jgi:hypothetical protein
MYYEWIKRLLRVSMETNYTTPSERHNKYSYATQKYTNSNSVKILKR